MESATIEAGSLRPMAVVAPPHVETRHRFEFRGSAAEYFRIWIVNLALSVVTLGIYSAWAKVRRLKYLYGHTYLDGSAFGYHGDPMKILKGRAIAAALFVAYMASGMFGDVPALLAGLAFALAMPWLVVKSLKFRRRMTSWRGVRFDFDENFGEAYRIYLGWGALTALSLGLLLPVFLQRLHTFTVERSAYGAACFACEPPLKSIYLAFLKAVCVAVLIFVILTAATVALSRAVAGASSSVLGAAFVSLLPLLCVAATYLVAAGIFNAGLLNAVHGSTTLGPQRHRLHSSLKGRTLAGLYFSNSLAIVLSFGLLVPWATIRTLRYRLETLELTAVGSLDELVARESTASPSATGEEVAELFDVDFGL